jgi:hypothetical protein
MSTIIKITPTILNDFSYLSGLKTPITEDEQQRVAEARKNFLSKLAKLEVVAEPTSPLFRGREFEEFIYNRTCGHPLELMIPKTFPSDLQPDQKKFQEIVEDLAKIVSGSTFQERVNGSLKSDISSEDVIYRLTGVADFINHKEKRIYDIKYSQRRKKYKYQYSLQHRLYMYCTGLEKFSYLISDGVEWWREDYYAEPANDLKFLLKHIKDMRAWIAQDQEATKHFEQHWFLQS